jgi:hypothetical protein
MPRLAVLSTTLCLLASPWGLMAAQEDPAAVQQPAPAKVDSGDFDYDKTRKQLRLLEHQLNVERQKLDALQGKAKTLDGVANNSAKAMSGGRSSGNTAVTDTVVSRNRQDAAGADRAVDAQRAKVADLEQRVTALKAVLEGSGGRTDKTARMKIIDSWIADNRAQRTSGTTEFDLERTIADHTAANAIMAKSQARIQDIDILVKLADQDGAAALNQERQKLQADLARQDAQCKLLRLQYHRYLMVTMDLDDPLQQAAAADVSAIQGENRATTRQATRSMADFKKDYDELRPALILLRKDRSARALSDDGAELLNNLMDTGFDIIGDKDIGGVHITPRLYRAVMGKPFPPSLAMCSDGAIQQRGSK